MAIDTENNVSQNSNGLDIKIMEAVIPCDGVPRRLRNGEIVIGRSIVSMPDGMCRYGFCFCSCFFSFPAFLFLLFFFVFSFVSRHIYLFLSCFQW
jgi:hypothetical protein